MTLTSGDLQAIGKLLEPIHRKLETVATKQDIKKIVTGNNSILGTIFKVELASAAKEIIKVSMLLSRKIESQEKRIDRLEEHTRPAKN